ncbi:MAG: hypothetical protein AAGA84_11410 [Pseudomonadota bacterium]
MEFSANLGIFGFWLFIAVATASGIWSEVKEKESQQATLRELIASGQELDDAMLEKVFNSGKPRNTPRDMRMAAIVVASAAAGLFMLGLFLGLISTEATIALTGVAALAGCVAAGLYGVARFVERENQSA